MKAAQIRSYGGPEVLRVEDAAMPVVSAPDDVLVRVHAASVNPIDWLFRNGYGQKMFQHQLPMTLGCDFSGVVESVGSAVTRFAAGDAVYGYVNLARNGAFAEYALAKESELGKKPNTLDFMASAAIPVVFLTAYQSIFDLGGLQSSQRLLVHGAAGGVGSSAVQLAKWRGAYVIGTASARNLEFVRQLGADEVIDYHTRRFEEVAKEMDVVLDTVGGDTQERSFQVLRKGGALVATIQPPPEESAKAAGVQGKFVNAAPNGNRLEELALLFDQQTLRVFIERVFSLDDIAEAFALSESRRARGKIILEIA